MTLSELRENLKQISLLQEAPEEFCEALADDLFPDLCRQYEEVAAQLFQSAVTSTMQSKRKTLAEFQVHILGLFYFT